MIHAGATAFLQQAHRNNWQQYLAALRPGAAPGWDICVLTASDERQAEMYRCQLNWRREAGLLPPRMRLPGAPRPRRPAHRLRRRNIERPRAGRRPGRRRRMAGGWIPLQRVLFDPLRRRLQTAAALLGDGQALRPRAARPARWPRLHHLRRVLDQPQRAGDATAARRADRVRRCPADLRSSPALVPAAAASSVWRPRPRPRWGWITAST